MPVKLAPQRLEKRIIRTHDDAAIRANVSFRPETYPVRVSVELRKTRRSYHCLLKRVGSRCDT
jgi:hypothetical protein